MMKPRARWVFGKSKATQEAERNLGEAHFGSRFSNPIYEDAYAEAADALLEHATKEDRLSELAQPILYLQRHTLWSSPDLVDTRITLLES